MAFGSYPEISLADARAAHAAARALLLRGSDPMAERKAKKSVELTSKRKAGVEANGDLMRSFREVAAQWLKKWKVGKVERYARDTETRLEEDVLSRIGNRPIAAIKPSEIANMILAIEERGAADVARRALQNTQQIFRYAMAFGLAEQNPAAAFRPSDILKQRVTANFARVEASVRSLGIGAHRLWNGCRPRRRCRTHAPHANAIVWHKPARSGHVHSRPGRPRCCSGAGKLSAGPPCGCCRSC